MKIFSSVVARGATGAISRVVFNNAGGIPLLYNQKEGRAHRRLIISLATRQSMKSVSRDYNENAREKLEGSRKVLNKVPCLSRLVKVLVVA